MIRPLPRRNRALWPLFGGRRIRLRPSVPVGQQAHRARPAPRRRPYNDDWHRLHLRQPRDLVPESNMPAYPWLAKTMLNPADSAPRMKALSHVGVPYTKEEIDKAADDVKGKTERRRDGGLSAGTRNRSQECEMTMDIHLTVNEPSYAHHHAVIHRLSPVLCSGPGAAGSERASMRPHSCRSQMTICPKTDEKPPTDNSFGARS